jgi:hypothetical protein
MKTGRPPGKTIGTPISDLDRVKAFNIREKTDSKKSSRELKSTDAWKERNTHGNKKTK